MSSVGRIQAVLAAATNEVTVAAANLNFDFTLIKCEAPKEFQPLGNVLSQRRKDDAEYGSTHVLARRLGALFEGFLPATPNLLQAYGSRVSEIAQASRRTSSLEPENSMFSAHVGIDGTSIWAAATSSSTALHVQLLACMLARVWPASEATSIWVELVKERRQEIGKRWNQNEALPYASLAAASQSQISRVGLAEWDASARSWLRTADRVMVKCQDQLMILIANVNVPINQDMGVYLSVITAWSSALESIERLMSGMPQASNHGPCLLALSSWHLYPDIICMGQNSVSHKFEDPLVRPGGTLTLGLAPPGGSALRGVFWSLSLAHLNFYGRRPVKREAELNLKSQKLTFQQFTIAVFGAFLARWNVFGPDAEAAARFFTTLRSAIQMRASGELSSDDLGESPSTVTNHSLRGIEVLATAASAALDAWKFDDDIILKLIALGGKKAPKFIPNSSYQGFKGLCKPGVLLPLVKGPDERITLLRRVLLNSITTAPNQETYLIRFFHTRLSQVTWEDGRSAGIATGDGRRDAIPNDGVSNYPHVRWAPDWYLQGIARIPGLHHDVVHEMSCNDAILVGSRKHEFVLEKRDDGGNTYLQTYRYIYGDPGSAAIYTSTAEASERTLRPLTVEDLVWCLELDLVDIKIMLTYLETSRNLFDGQHTLRPLSIAHQIYRALPSATVSTRALNRPLSSARWASLHYEHRAAKVPAGSQEAPKISQSMAFSCVAWLEAGADIDPDDLRRVFALAYEDSIYVSMQLTCDPWESPNAYELKRLTGNVGKPGLTLLIPPTDPLVPMKEECSWRLLSVSVFNGLAEDCFSKTSMHLSFTEYYVPLAQTDAEQSQDQQVYYLESVVSIYHAGEWIGDVDIQQCLRGTLLVRSPETRCNKEHSTNKLKTMRSIECWEDIIDPPAGNSVVRAHGNWF
ncbi:hypothetical protein VMCG_08302 [Cytospora schulzeri]|uniref:Uncharacterized protein n=1 Tax=Cytospora schulzeri TaxID=448051 RepID=A0A423VVF0_9PEZI|nr:hypothetical protein VMCG_08302 [Valsa malicola]